MYLAFILEDIAAMQATDNPIQLEILPRGLDGYYENFWSSIAQFKDAKGFENWRQLYRPVIELLGASGEPVTAEWLVSLTGRDADEVHEQARYNGNVS